jgi:hypothetical protein
MTDSLPAQTAVVPCPARCSSASGLHHFRLAGHTTRSQLSSQPVHWNPRRPCNVKLVASAIVLPHPLIESLALFRRISKVAVPARTPAQDQ